MDVRCYECEKTSELTELRKCAICFRYFCEEHTYHMSGRAFCSEGCAHYFFFTEPDD